MAIITPSSLIGEIRGSSGSQTFSRNKYRAYVKNRVAPTDTPSAYKTVARTYMQNAVTAWQGMTDAQRIGWCVNAQQFNSRLRLGTTKPLSGFNYFTRYAILSQYAGLSINTIPGSPTELPTLTTLQFNAFTSNISFDIQPAFTNANLVIHMYASPPLSGAIQSVNSTQLLWLRSENLSSGLNVADMTTEWEDRFGPTSSYDHATVFAGIRIMDVVSGSISPMIVQKNFINGEGPVIPA